MKHFCFNSVWSFGGRFIVSYVRNVPQTAGENLILFCFAEGHFKKILSSEGFCFLCLAFLWQLLFLCMFLEQLQCHGEGEFCTIFGCLMAGSGIGCLQNREIFWQCQERRKRIQIFQVIHDMDECMHELYDYTETYRYVYISYSYIYIYIFIFTCIYFQIYIYNIYIYIFAYIYIFTFIYTYFYIYIYSDVSKAVSLQKQNPKQKNS